MAEKLSPGEIAHLAKGIISEKPSSAGTTEPDEDMGELQGFHVDGADNGVSVTPHTKSVVGKDPADIRAPKPHVFTNHEAAKEHVSGLLKHFFKGKK
jgi:hypothetical protein